MTIVILRNLMDWGQSSALVFIAWLAGISGVAKASIALPITGTFKPETGRVTASTIALHSH